MAREYKVIDITEMARPTKVGGVETYYRHRIETRGGTVLHVDIDEKDFTEEKAGPILAAKAVEADKIKAL